MSVCGEREAEGKARKKRVRVIIVLGGEYCGEIMNNGTETWNT